MNGSTEAFSFQLHLMAITALVVSIWKSRSSQDRKHVTFLFFFFFYLNSWLYVVQIALKRDRKFKNQKKENDNILFNKYILLLFAFRSKLLCFLHALVQTQRDFIAPKRHFKVSSKIEFCLIDDLVAAEQIVDSV